MCLADDGSTIPLCPMGKGESWNWGLLLGSELLDNTDFLRRKACAVRFKNRFLDDLKQGLDFKAGLGPREFPSYFCLKFSLLFFQKLLSHKRTLS